MSNTDLALFIAGFILSEALMLVFIFSACKLAGEADDAADKAAHDLTDAERINAINSGASLSPRTGPAASTPHTARLGNVLNSNFHAAIPSQKGRRDNV